MTRSLAAFLPIAIALLFSGCGTFRSEGSGDGIGAISPDVVREHVTYLASDSMMGRNTPSPQLDSAAEYIAREFRELGIAPCKGNYFQRVPLNIIALGNDNTLTLTVRGVERAFELKTDFVPFEMTANASVTAPLLFAGYGITAPEYGYDDYAGLDVRGKVVLLLRHEPLEEDSASRFDGREATPYSNVDTKLRIAREHGAIGVLIVTDPLESSEPHTERFSVAVVVQDHPCRRAAGDPRDRRNVEGPGRSCRSCVRGSALWEH